MDANISNTEFSPDEITSIERRIGLYPESVLKEVLGRLRPAATSEIVPVIFKASKSPFSSSSENGYSGLLYGILPDVFLSSGSPDGWAEKIIVSGYTERDVLRAIARKLCASLIPGMAQQPYEISACIRIDEEPGRPASEHRLSVQKAARVEAVAA